MPHTVIMPKTGMAMEEGTLVRWLKQVGDPVTKGEAIAVIETDKVTMDLESDYDGTLLSIVHRDGEIVKATHTIAWIGAPGEKIPAEAAAAAAAPAPAVLPIGTQAPVLTSRVGKVPATPAARAAAVADRHFPLVRGGLRPRWRSPVAGPRAGAIGEGDPARAEGGADERHRAGKHRRVGHGRKDPQG